MVCEMLAVVGLNNIALAINEEIGRHVRGLTSTIFTCATAITNACPIQSRASFDRSSDHRNSKTSCPAHGTNHFRSDACRNTVVLKGVVHRRVWVCEYWEWSPLLIDKGPHHIG